MAHNTQTNAAHPLAHSKSNQLSPHSQESARKIIESLTQDFQKEICKGIVVVSEDQRPFKLQDKPNDENQSDINKKIQEIQNKKQMAKKQLEEIQAEEEEILKTSKISSSKVVANKYFKSELTPEDVEKLKALQAARRRFERQLQEKTDKYEEKIKKLKQKQQNKLKLKRQRQLESRRQDLEKTIDMMEKRREDKKLLIEDENKRLQSILKQKKLYEEMQSRWKENEQEERKKEESLKQEIRKNKNIDFEEIKEHARKYQETIQYQRQSRIKNSSVFNQWENSPYHSIFMDAIKEEEERKKEMEELKKAKTFELAEKKKDYGEQVRINYKPKFKYKKDNKENESKSVNNQNRSLSLFQTHEKGNEYMRTVNTQLSGKSKGKTNEAKEEPKAFKYKNYLAEIRRSPNSDNFDRTPLDKIHEIMNKQGQDQDKIYEAKLLAQRLEGMGQKQTDSGLLNSINVKLAILKELE